jgi:hypothetical protein
MNFEKKKSLEWEKENEAFIMSFSLWDPNWSNQPCIVFINVE